MNDDLLRLADDGCPNCHDLDREPRVTGIRGRFPSSSHQALRQEDIEVSVTELAPGVYTLRFDSRIDDSFWLQITVKI